MGNVPAALLLEGSVDTAACYAMLLSQGEMRGLLLRPLAPCLSAALVVLGFVVAPLACLAGGEVGQSRIFRGHGLPFCLETSPLLRVESLNSLVWLPRLSLVAQIPRLWV